jgi:hypothetical protein
MHMLSEASVSVTNPNALTNPGHLNPGHLRLTQGFRFNVVNWCWNLTN